MALQTPPSRPRALQSAANPDMTTGTNERWDDTHRYESGHLLAVLDELHTDALADSGVGLLGLNANLLKHDSLCVRGTSSGRGLVNVAKGPLLVRLVRLQNK